VKRGDIREQQLDGSPTGSGLVPGRLKVVETQNTLLGRQRREYVGLYPDGVTLRSRPRLEQGESICERDEERLARFYRFAGDDIARVAEAGHDSIVRERGVGEGGLAHAPGTQYSDASWGRRRRNDEIYDPLLLRVASKEDLRPCRAGIWPESKRQNNREKGEEITNSVVLELAEGCRTCELGGHSVDG